MTLLDHRLWSKGKQIIFRGCSGFEKEHLCLASLFKVLSTAPKLKYMCENSTNRRFRENQNQGVITANWGLPFKIVSINA